MRLSLATGFAAVLCISAVAVAQGPVTGTYNGKMEVTTSRGPQRGGVTMVIKSVESGKVKGTGTIQQGPCRGDYPIEGNVKGDAIGVISKGKGGASGDCVFGFRGKIDGNRLVGSMGKYEVEFRK
jgi:hypothetical protein